MKSIKSYTMKNLLDYREPDFIHHDEYTSQLEEPELKYCYANTIVLEVKSSHYNDPEYVNKKTGKTKGYGLKYKVFILLEDFYTIAEDKDIDFAEAVEYALRYGDVHVRCTCPAHLFWGYAYISTQLRYVYGLPRENRPPVIRNPSMKGTTCKHEDKAITYCLQNMNLIAKMFMTYYSKFHTGDILIAIDDTGKPVSIGVKDGEGDVFFEQDKEMKSYEEEIKAREHKEESQETEEVSQEEVEEPQEDDNVIEEE